MIRIHTFHVVILIGCIALISCERTQKIVAPGLTNEDTINTDSMIDTIAPEGKGTPVVINELMADNDNILADAQGDYDDWLELHNRTNNAVMLTGMYLSDKKDEPTKWKFPKNAEIPAKGYLIVWLDDDGIGGLHANFKLSKDGETVMLVDTDAKKNQVLDSITFGKQETDTAFGRLPDGTGDFQIVKSTPGAPNVAK